MNVIDQILNEWSFRCHDGIVDMNDPTKLSILNEILASYNLNEQEKGYSELGIELEKIVKNLDYGSRLKALKYLEKINQKEEVAIHKTFFKNITPSLEKRGLQKKEASNIFAEFADIDKEEELIKFYKQLPSISIEQISSTDFSIKDPIYKIFKEIGCQECIEAVNKLYNDFASAAGTKGIGKEENFLVAFYNNVKKKTDKGDIEIGNKEYEIKGNDSYITDISRGKRSNTDPILDDLISQIKNQFKDIYSIYEEEINQIKNPGTKWVSSVTNLGNKYFKDNIEKYVDVLEESLRKIYKNITLGNSVLKNGRIDANDIAIRIAQNSIDNVANDYKNITLIFVSKDGKTKVVNSTDELKNLINNGINITSFSDLVPRLEYNGKNTFSDEKISRAKQTKPESSQKQIEIKIPENNYKFKGNKEYVSTDWLNQQKDKKVKNYFNQIAPKTFPNSNKQWVPLKSDNVKLQTLAESLANYITELFNTSHFQLRLGERGKVLDILNLDKIPLKDYKFTDVKEKLKTNISEEIAKRAENILGKDIPSSLTYDVGIKILKPVLVVDGKKYSLKLFAISTKERKDKDGNVIEIVDVENRGTLYFATVSDNRATTLMLLDKEDDSELYSQVKTHAQEKKKKENKEVKILSPGNYIYEIDIDELMGNKAKKEEQPLVDPATLSYKVRTDYRKDANFEHNTFGTGKIVNTSAGSGGKGDSRGMVDWVDVKYPKPFLKGGKLTDIRRFEKILTLASPLLKK